MLDEEEALQRTVELTVDTVGAFAVRARGQCTCSSRIARFSGGSSTKAGRRPSRADLDQRAETVSTLSHEIQHIVNPAGEAETECAGVQHNS